VAASLLLMTLGTTAFLAREHRRQRSNNDSAYTRNVRLHDSALAARAVLATLADAEIQAQAYALTGETVYFKAFTRSIGECQQQQGIVSIQKTRQYERCHGRPRPRR
jgi:CHASE3 domain sensor protein